VLLGGLFTAHITGNIVVLAANLVTGTPPRLAAVLALPVFVITVVLATVIAHRDSDRPARSRTILLGGQALFLVAAAALSFTTRASADPDAPTAVLIGMCAVTAMALQNAYLHLLLATAPSTAVMTGNLVTAVIAAIDLATSRGTSASARTKWGSSWPLLAGFITGCFVGSAASALLSDHAAVVPAVLAVGILVRVRYGSGAERPALPA
jgi:uncharacterized membrane protein YoaK (UPF0700 family)